MELQELVEKKRKLFKRVFGDKYWLRLLELKIWDNKDGRTLAECLSFSGN